MPQQTKAKSLELVSSLSPADCQARLSAAIDKERWPLISFTSIFGSKPVIGWVTESSLRLRRRIYYSNSNQMFFTGTIRQEGGGSVISGSFAEHPFVRGSMIFWFGSVIFLGSIGFIVTICEILSGSAHLQEGAWFGLAIPPVMLIFGIGLVKFCRFLARKEPEFLTEFLLSTLDAKIRSGPRDD